MRDHIDHFRFAERVVRGRDENGDDETVTLWIDRRAGALWQVGRASNLHLRENPEPRPEDTLFEGFEMTDALEAANNALEADVVASEGTDDHNDDVHAFSERELREKLERWFFDHS